MQYKVTYALETTTYALNVSYQSCLRLFAALCELMYALKTASAGIGSSATSTLLQRTQLQVQIVPEINS